MITAIKYFLEVAETRNFTRAAWDLKLAPSIITKKIKQLEDKLGYPLFYRTTRKVSLTPEGQLFLKKAELLVSGYDHLFDPLDPKTLAPLIKIAAAYGAAKYFVIKHLPEFSTRYPKIKFEFVKAISPLAIAEGDVDLAIGTFNIEIMNMVKIVLFESKRHLFASPNYIARFGTPKKPDDLLHHHCLVNLTAHPDRTWEFNNEEITIEPKLSSYDGSLLIEAALEGLGIINSPEEMLLEYVNAGQLIPLKMPVDEERTFISMIHKKLPKDHIVQQFAEFINKKAKQLLPVASKAK